MTCSGARLNVMVGRYSAAVGVGETSSWLSANKNVETLRKSDSLFCIWLAKGIFCRIAIAIPFLS